MAVAIPKTHLLRQPHFYFFLALLVAIGGFWSSFFSKLFKTDVAHLVHGISATLWMTVPILQSWLSSRRKFNLHRRMGWATIAILGPL